MRDTWKYMLVSCLMVALFACGGDDESDSSDDDGDTSAEESGAGSSGNGDGDGDTDEPAEGAARNCNPDIPGVATCGGTECGLPNENLRGAPACQVPCCVEAEGEEICGTRSAMPENPSDCVAEAVLDDSCPSVDPAMGMSPLPGMMPLPGCCTPDGRCGVVSALSGACITTSMFIPLPENPQGCGANAGEGGGDEPADEEDPGDEGDGEDPAAGDEGAGDDAGA